MNIPGLSTLVNDLKNFEPQLLGKLDALIERLDILIEIERRKQ